MTPKDLMDLMDFISRSNFVEFEIEQEGLKLRLSKAGARRRPREEAARVAHPAVLPAPAPLAAPPAPPAPVAPREDGLLEVRSPMVGTFYRRSSPEAASFVEAGHQVRPGQVLCIIEAMKLMNEIESEVEGELVEVLVEDGQPVEYGELLFRIRPSV